MSRSVLIIINALHSGGAEKTCVEIARRLLERYEVTIVSLLGGGPTEHELRAMGVRVELLRASSPLRAAGALVRLARLVRDRRPEAVLSFLYYSDFVGSVIARLFAPGAKVYWNVRNNVLTWKQTGAGSYYAAKACALASRILPYEVVYCSPLSRLQHEAIGYRPPRSSVIENSAAAVPFSFSVEARNTLRRGRFEREFLFLFVGRYDRVKRVDLYVDACSRTFRLLGGEVRFLIAGRGMERRNTELLEIIAATGCADRFELLGFVDDRAALYSAADCLVVTSESEGSPNVVYEAIATRLPVIIFGTLGTEHIAAECVQRLESRDVGVLASAMHNRRTSQKADIATRICMEQHPASHPLVAHYRRALSWQ